ncbi:hypothetical protein [Petrachloros mirabilis]
MKYDSGMTGEREFETWLGGEAHVPETPRRGGLWPRLRGKKAIVRSYAFAGLVVGVIIGISAATAFFRGSGQRTVRPRERDTAPTKAGKE